MLSAPAATDNARLATSSDLPTLGSPPTNRMPCGGNNPRCHQARRRSSGLLLQQLTPATTPPRIWVSQQRLCGGVQQNRLVDEGRFARRRETQRRQSQFVGFAQNGLLWSR